MGQITKILLTARKAQGLGFGDLERVVGLSEDWVAAMFYRQASASREEASKLTAAPGLVERLD